VLFDFKKGIIQYPQVRKRRINLGVTEISIGFVDGWFEKQPKMRLCHRIYKVVYVFWVNLL